MIQIWFYVHWGDFFCSSIALRIVSGSIDGRCRFFGLPVTGEDAAHDGD